MVSDLGNDAKRQGDAWLSLGDGPDRAEDAEADGEGHGSCLRFKVVRHIARNGPEYSHRYIVDVAILDPVIVPHIAFIEIGPEGQLAVNNALNLGQETDDAGVSIG